MRLTAGVLILEPGVGSRKTCGVGLCLVSFVRCGGVFSIISPLSLLSSYLIRLPALSVLSVPFSSGAVFLRRGFSHVRQGGVGRLPTARSSLHTCTGAGSLLPLLRGLLLLSSSSRF